LHSAAYLSENADAIRHDWPRLPLPQSSERLATSAAVGLTDEAALALLGATTYDVYLRPPHRRPVAPPTPTRRQLPGR